MTRFQGIFLATGLALFGVAHAQDQVMSGEEIRAAWSDKTLTGTIGAGPHAGKSIELQLKADGTAVLSGTLTDTGTWRIQAQSYCATWAQIRAGQERCFAVVRRGADMLALNPDGSTNTIITSAR